MGLFYGLNLTMNVQCLTSSLPLIKWLLLLLLPLSLSTSLLLFPSPLEAQIPSHLSLREQNSVLQLVPMHQLAPREQWAATSPTPDFSPAEGGLHLATGGRGSSQGKRQVLCPDPRHGTRRDRLDHSQAAPSLPGVRFSGFFGQEAPRKQSSFGPAPDSCCPLRLRSPVPGGKWWPKGRSGIL